MPRRARGWSSSAPPSVGNDRPALVIAPAPPDLQVSRRVPLAAEAEAPDQPERREITGLDVGLQPVQTEPAEGRADDERHGLGHEALPRVRRERIVAEVGAPEHAAHDLADVHDADELARAAAADEVADVRRRAQP